MNPWVCIWAFWALIVTSYLSVLAYGPLFIWTFWPLPSHNLPVSAGLWAIVYMDILALAKSQVTFAYKVSDSFPSFWFCMLANPAEEIGPEGFDVLKWLGYNLQLTRTFGDEQLLLLGPVRSKAKSLDSYGSLKRRVCFVPPRLNSRSFPPLYSNLSAYPHCLLDFFEITTLVVLVHPTTHFY